MGQVVTRLAAEESDLEIVCGVDVAPGGADYPVVSDLKDFDGPADVVVDFSNPAALDGILSFCIKRTVPVVLCATGYSEVQIDAIRRAAEVIPVFRSGNMSLGINLMADLIRRAVAVLGEDYDIELVEKHHNKKLDAPSGTALMLADAANEARGGSMRYVYGRSDVRKAREKDEIGISSIRGGTIVGEHEILFAGHDEVITITHAIGSREVFAGGALKAARFMANIKTPGMYDMTDVING